MTLLSHFFALWYHIFCFLSWFAVQVTCRHNYILKCSRRKPGAFKTHGDLVHTHPLIHIKLDTSIDSYQITHIHSFISNSTYPFIHIKLHTSIDSYQSTHIHWLISNSTYPFIHTTLHSFIDSYQITHPLTHIKLHSLNDSYQVTHIHWFL